MTTFSLCAYQLLDVGYANLRTQLHRSSLSKIRQIAGLQAGHQEQMHGQRLVQAKHYGAGVARDGGNLDGTIRLWAMWNMRRASFHFFRTAVCVPSV